MKLFKELLAAVALVVPVSSFAITFDFAGGVDYKTSRQYSSGGLNLTVTGYTGNNKITSTSVGAFGQNGLGAEKANTPNHAVDNSGSNFDMLLFTFDQAVSLDSTSIGWWQNDSDLTVLAYTGTGSAASTFTNKSWSQAITTANWSGGHFMDVAATGKTASSNPLDLFSTTWLIGTFLQPVDAKFSRYGTNKKTGEDYVKIKSVSVSTPPPPPHEVPEIDGSHAALALALLSGLVAFATERRRKFAA